MAAETNAVGAQADAPTQRLPSYLSFPLPTSGLFAGQHQEELEHQVRRQQRCDLGGVIGGADLNYIEPSEGEAPQAAHELHVCAWVPR